MPHIFLIIAPLVCFVLLYLTAIRWGVDRCGAVLVAGIVFGVVVVGITELLSLGHFLTSAGVFCSWLVAAAAGTIAFLMTLDRRPSPQPSPGVPGEGDKERQPRIYVRLERRDHWVIGGIILVAGFVGVLGLIGAPTNWDSMTYHLSRVMHWMMNRSVAHYPTQCLAQLYQGPGAEFAILQLQLLWGSDRLAFGVQWLSMIGCIFGVVCLARRLGAGVRGQLLAAVFVVTLPAGILQGQSTQNNWVLAFWMLCWAEAIFRIRVSESAVGPAFFAGAAAGLGVLTKGTAYLLCFPLFVWMVAEAMRFGWKRGGRVLVIVGLVGATLNVGHWTRNWKEFGSLLVPKLEEPYLPVTAMSGSLWVSNALRNLALQLATPSQLLNNSMVRAIAGIDGKMGVDPNDPRITFPGRAFAVAAPGNSEDLMGNPWHLMILGCAVIGAVFGAWRSTKNRDAYRRALGLLMLVVGGFIVFCASLKWQPFHSRLHLPLFILAAAPVGLLLEQWVGKEGFIFVAGALFVGILPVLLDNPGRPIFGQASIFWLSRSQQYFANNPALYPKYIQIADALAAGGDSHIGFLADRNGWEYPLWVLLHDRFGRWPVIKDLTEETVKDAGRLDAVIVLDLPRDGRKLPDEMREWRRVFVDDRIALLMRSRWP